MNISKLELLIRRYGKSKVQVAKECGITRMTLDNILAGKDTKVSIIESLARVLGVEVGYLFHDDDTSTTQTMTTVNQSGGNNTQNVGQSPDVESLRKQIEEKDRQIARLLDIIQAMGK